MALVLDNIITNLILERERDNSKQTELDTYDFRVEIS